MTYGNTDLIKALVSNSSITDVFRKELEKTINLLLETELTEFLSYEKYAVEGYNTGNSRNGYYVRHLKTQFGEISVQIPRDRAGKFNNKTIEPYRREFGDLETTIIHLYRKGITTREIADLIEKMYGCHYSAQSISNITKIVQKEVDAFHQCSLHNSYAAIYCDATFISVKRNTVQKEALHVLLGITPSGQKEVLDYIIRPNESLDAYSELLTSIKKRGVNSVLLFISDGFIGLKDLCLTQYPAAKFQRCWVHILRHIQKLIRRKDLAVVMSELKRIYQATSYEQATSILGNFLATWQPIYPKLQGILSDITDLFTYYEFPASIRASIYTTNIIEQFNKHLKRIIGKKEQFPNETSLERFVCSYANEYNAKFFERTHRGFAQAHIDL